MDQGSHALPLRLFQERAEDRLLAVVAPVGSVGRDKGVFQNGEAHGNMPHAEQGGDLSRTEPIPLGDELRDRGEGDDAIPAERINGRGEQEGAVHAAGECNPHAVETSENALQLLRGA
jgi:hypothetical protein